MAELVLVIAGIGSGVVTGLTGGNGFSVLVAVLLIAGVDVHTVVGICLGTQAFTMSTALIPQARAEGMPWALVPILCLPAIPASVLGARVALWLPGPALEGLAVAGLLVIGGLLLRGRREGTAPPSTSSPEPKTSPGEATTSRHEQRRGAVAAVGAASGMLSGMLGGGGNIVVANALHSLVGVPFRRAVALSLCLGVVSAVSGVVPYVSAGRLDLSSAPWIVVPGVIVAPLVSQLATKVKVSRVRRLQGLYLVATALLLAVRLFRRA